MTRFSQRSSAARYYGRRHTLGVCAIGIGDIIPSPLGSTSAQAEGRTRQGRPRRAHHLLALFTEQINPHGLANPEILPVIVSPDQSNWVREEFPSAMLSFHGHAQHAIVEALKRANRGYGKWTKHVSRAPKRPALRRPCLPA